LASESRKLKVSASDAGTRLDIFVASAFAKASADKSAIRPVAVEDSAIPELSRSAVQRLIEDGHILVDGRTYRAGHKLSGGEIVQVTIPPPEPTDIRPERIPLDIIYEDSDIAVVNKPRGMTVHPAPGSPSHTLVNAILAHCKDLSGVGGVERPGIVHRLDKDTSGLLVVAKNDAAHLALQSQIQKRTMKRRYLAVVHGETKFTDAEIDAPIGRHPTDRKRMAVIEYAQDRGLKARRAITHLHVLERFREFTFLEARLETGRTHQIRVHISYIGHPVVGDPVYGPKRPLPSQFGGIRQRDLAEIIRNLGGQALHAASLAFRHPRTGEEMTFEAPPLDDMARLLTWLRENAAGSPLPVSGRGSGG